MPKAVNSDAQAYDREYGAFMKQLDDFHIQRGTTFKRLPQINGKCIDLYLLYVVVTARGGWQKVNARNEWEDILEDFRLPSSCINSSTALKHIYIRYLDVYERINFHGEECDDRSNDPDEDESRSHRQRRSVRAVNIVPLSYNHQQHNIQDNVRLGCGMSTDLYQASSYDRLALSLSCPLPNEYDFSFNLCTLLSNEGKHTLQLAHCPRLLELMLAHTGVFKDRETLKYFLKNYKDTKGKSLIQFWKDSVEDDAVLDLLFPEVCESTSVVVKDGVLPQITSNDSSLPGSNKDQQSADSPTSIPETPKASTITPTTTDLVKDCGGLGPDSSETESRTRPEQNSSVEGSADSRNLDGRGRENEPSSIEEALGCETGDLRLDRDDEEIFHLGRDLGLMDLEGTRISQVLHILRNLSFEESNVATLAQSETCLRFLVLCVCSRWGGLSVGALDTLGNIASEVLLKDPVVDSTSSLLLTTICQGVSSQDRAVVLRSLEVLNRLSLNDPNEDTLSGSVDQAVYDQICRFLTIHDIMLLIYTLEALYSLSSMGMSSCNCIVRAKGCVQTLVSLLTVEAQSYGPDACIGMKVVETVTGVVNETETTTVVSNPTPVPTPVTVAPLNTPPPPTITTTATTAATTATLPPIHTIHSSTPVLAAAAAAAAASSASVTSSTTGASTTPKSLPKPSDFSKRVVPSEVEEFVTNWVLRNYDACPTNAIEQGIVYRHFAASMHSLGRKQGLNPVLLSNCVRKVFGTNVGPCRRQVEDGTEKWHYNGIKRKEGVMLPPIADKRTFNSTNLSSTPIVQSIRTPVSVNSPQGSAGSILKAQLSAPLRNSPSPVKVVGQGVGVAASPGSPNFRTGSHPPAQSSPQLIPRTDNSSLIKSLLANKVITTSSGVYGIGPTSSTAGHPVSSVVGYPAGSQSPQVLFPPNKPPPPYTAPHSVSRPRLQSTASGNQMAASPSLSGAPPTHIVRSVNPNTPRLPHFVGASQQQPLPGYDQISRAIPKTEAAPVQQRVDGQVTNSIGKTLPSFNGLCNDLSRNESNASETNETRKVTSFEGILQNGIKEDEDSLSLKTSDKNLLADLLEKTVGGDMLNGVVEKDLRITDKIVMPSLSQNSQMSFAKVNGPLNTNGQADGFSLGVKRPATPDAQNSVKRLAVEDTRPGAETKVTYYINQSQNGNEGEKGQTVFLNQNQIVTSNQIGSSQTLVNQHGQQVIIQRSVSQTPTVVSSPTIQQQVISQRVQQQSHFPIVNSGSGAHILSTTSSNVNSNTGNTILSSQGGQTITTNSGQVVQQVISHGQSGQKVILHGSQLSQMLAGQMILPQGTGQNIIVQGPGNIPGQMIVQGVSTPSTNQNSMLVQGANGHNQVLVSGGTSQNQVLIQGNTGQGQLVMGGVNHGQAVVNAAGQTMILTGTPGQMVVGGQGGQQVVVGGQGGQQVVVGGQGGQQVVVGGQGGQQVVVGGQGGQQVVVGGQGGQQVVVSGSQSQGQVLLPGGGVGNAVFLSPQNSVSQGSQQKTLIILPSTKMVVSGGAQSQNNPVMLQRQVVQVVSSSNNVSQSTPIRTIRTTTVQPEHRVSSTASNVISVQVSTGSNSGLGQAPTAPKATLVSQTPTASTPVPHIPAPQVLASGVVRRPSATGLQYICEWRGCNQIFGSPGQVYHHVCKIHCPPHIPELTCQWAGCDAMVRKRFSTMTHIHDRHCNEQLLQVLALRRQQIATAGKTDIPMPQTPPPHPGYAPNAAYHAIKRHSLEVINHRDAVEKEGPVTKSIRLTAALVLRNLVIYSTSGKALLKGYESELSNVAISQMESSRTVSQILYDIHLGE